MQIPAIDPNALSGSSYLVYVVIMGCLGLFANFALNVIKFVGDKKKENDRDVRITPPPSLPQDLELKIREAITLQAINHANVQEKMKALGEHLDEGLDKIENALTRQADALARYFEKTTSVFWMAKQQRSRRNAEPTQGPDYEQP